MGYYREELKELQGQAARKKHLEAKLSELNGQQGDLQKKVQELDAIQKKEQLDVDRLEGSSLKSFFYNVVGKMDEKLTKEREEAYAAAVKYQAAARELEAVEYGIRQSEEELGRLAGCEEKYEALLSETAAAAKRSGGAVAEAVLKKEEQLGELENQRREIREAIEAGEAARGVVKKVLAHLVEAEDLSTWDMFGGGLFVDFAKHDELDAAQHQIEKLQIELGKFKAELADVAVEANLKVNLDDFSRFADVFFDGLFMDWQVADEISASLTSVRNIQSQIELAMGKLETMLVQADEDEARLKKELTEVLLQA